MQVFLKSLLYALCLLFASDSIAQIRSSGADKVVIDEEKQPTIRYKWHEGEALMKTGLKLKGRFKYFTKKNEIPKFIFDDEENIPKRQKIDVSLFKELTLAGGEKGLSSIEDSTKFVWVDDFNDLFREIRKGDLRLYDNSKIVDEKYKYLSNHLLLAQHDEKGVRRVKQINDLEELMDGKPYFMKSAKATGKYYASDKRVAFYLVELFNEEDASERLNWDPIRLTKKDGTLVTGHGYMQPMDVRNEFNTDNHAYIHFYDGNGLKLFREDELNSVEYRGKTYQSGFFSLSNKNFFGIPWTYEGEEYLVTKKILNRNSYYYMFNGKNGEDITILKNLAGSFVRPNNESILRIHFMQEQGTF